MSIHWSRQHLNTFVLCFLKQGSLSSKSNRLQICFVYGNQQLSQYTHFITVHPYTFRSVQQRYYFSIIEDFAALTFNLYAKSLKVSKYRLRNSQRRFTWHCEFVQNLCHVIYFIFEKGLLFLDKTINLNNLNWFIFGEKNGNENLI